MIRNARPGDWDDIMEIYAIARNFMKTAGNPTQWGDTFPPEEMVREDIELQRNYVVEIDGRIQAVFAMIAGIAIHNVEILHFREVMFSCIRCKHT